eukprot:8031019-Ditylum_brightwellii.AAC.1
MKGLKTVTECLIDMKGGYCLVEYTLSPQIMGASLMKTTPLLLMELASLRQAIKVMKMHALQQSMH